MKILGGIAQNGAWTAVQALGFALFVALLCQPARAQDRSVRALRSVRSVESEFGWDVSLQLEFAARYLRHVPEENGAAVRIQIEPLETGDPIPFVSPFRQNLSIPPDLSAPIQEIFYERRALDEAFLEVRFRESVAFDVGQGDGLRAISIRIRPLAHEGRTASSGPPSDGREPEEANGAEVEEGRLLTIARTAIRDGELDRAILLLTKILDGGDEVSVNDRRAARELLGLTRERRGQLAHARAEYERYLQDHPDGDAADRVRQRLEALITASSAPSPGLRKRSRASAGQAGALGGVPFEYEVFGSLGIRYFRTDSFLEDDGAGFEASNVLTDFDLANRVDVADYRIRTDFTGIYDADLSGGNRSNDLRISRLSIQVEDEVRGLEATIGRQRRSDSGVLGRFDGAHVSASMAPRVRLSALAGMPVESTSDAAPNTETVLGGGAVDVEDVLLDGLAAQLWVIAQSTRSMTDRAAVGGDIRFASEDVYSFVYFDYDFLFQALNTAILSGTWYPTESTSLRFSAEHRKTPILELRTALQGQSAADLEALEAFLRESEIRDLARDRTQTVWTGSAGVTHRLSEQMQLSGDVFVAHSGATKDVLDARTGDQIPGADAVGPDVSLSTQLLVNDWLIETGVGSISARYFEGSTSRSFSVSGYGRIPVYAGVRAIPRLRWEWRDSDVQATRSIVRPSLEFDWRYESFVVDADAGVEWVESLSGGSQDRQTSYFLELGGRWEF